MMVKRHRRQNDEPLVRLGPSLSTAKSHAAVIVVDDSSDEECEGGSREASCSKRLPKTTPIETHATNRSELLRLPPSTASFPKGCPPLISPTSDSAHQRLRVLLAALSSPCNHPFPSSPSSRSMASPSSILSSSLLPSLVIVDLDYTLWKGNVSDQVPPFARSEHPDRVHVHGSRESWGFGASGRRGGAGSMRREGERLFSLFPEARQVHWEGPRG